METKTIYSVEMDHPNYPALHGTIQIEVTEIHDAYGHYCYCRAHAMGTSKNYPAKHNEAIRTFAAEHGARVVSITAL